MDYHYGAVTMQILKQQAVQASSGYVYENQTIGLA